LSAANYTEKKLRSAELIIVNDRMSHSMWRLGKKGWKPLVYLNWIDSHNRVEEMSLREAAGSIVFIFFADYLVFRSSS